MKFSQAWPYMNPWRHPFTEKFSFRLSFRFHRCEACQIIIMLAFGHQFGTEAVAFGIERQGVEVDIEPVEAVSPDIPILHAEVHLSVIVGSQVDEHLSVFVLEQIAQVARIHQHTTVVGKQFTL